MANYYIGDTVRDYFTVLDESDNPVPGLAPTFVSSLANGENTFMGVHDAGNGTYYVEFIPTVQGTYYYLLSVPTTPVQYFEANFDVDGSPDTVTIGTPGDGANTLKDLVYGVATEVGDLRVLIATEPGASDGSSFIDRIRGSGMPSESLKGANAWVATEASANYWRETRVIAYAGDTQVFSFQPALPYQIQTGEQLWLTNIQSRGWWRQQYIDSINASIRRMRGRNDVPINYLYENYPYEDRMEVAKPTNLTKLYGIEVWVGDDPYPQTMPMAPQNREDLAGWSYNYATGMITIRSYGWLPNELGAVRILGFGPETDLVNPGDVTRVPYAFIIPDAAARLMRGKGDPRVLANAAQTQNMAENEFAAAVVNYPPGTISVA